MVIDNHLGRTSIAFFLCHIEIIYDKNFLLILNFNQMKLKYEFLKFQFT